jgi:tight adherence protein C
MTGIVLLMVGVGAIFVAILACVISIVFSSPARVAVSRGIQAIDTVYSAPAVNVSLDQADRALPRSGVVAGLSRGLTPASARSWVQRQINYAGNPPNWPADRVLETQGMAMILAGVLGAVLGFLGNGLLGLLAGLLLGIAVGLGLPYLLVWNAAQRRQDQIRKDLPDALDLLTLSVEAGQGFDAAMSQVAASMTGPIAREFARTLQEMQMGRRRADALRAISDRTSIPEFRIFVTAIVQAGELGIPIAGVLREQASEMRLHRRQRAQEAARKVSVKMIFPMILLLLPAMLVVLIGPAFIAIGKSMLLH